MTDADRLRAAAEQAGIMADQLRRHRHATLPALADGELGHAYGCVPCAGDALDAAAALLRAVAEYHPVECSFARYGHICTPFCPRCRAEALADVILGGAK